MMSPILAIRREGNRGCRRIHFAFSVPAPHIFVEHLQ